MAVKYETRANGLVRVYPAVAHGPGLVWVHGGGFVGGNIAMPEADWVASQLAVRGITVISVDYRRAVPGAGYPIPSDDVIAAWDWAAAHCDELGVPLANLHLGGASAGANLAAGAVIRLIEHGGLLPAGVLFVYPTLLARQPEPDATLRTALDRNRGADTFGPDAVLAMYEAYLDGSTQDAPIAAIPGLASAEQLAKFPPTLVINAEVDELRLSGEAFAASLGDAGRPVQLRTEEGTVHGFLNNPGLPAAARSLDRIAQWARGEQSLTTYAN